MNRMLWWRLATAVSLGMVVGSSAAGADSLSVRAGPVMSGARMAHYATTLADGKVVMLGGHGTGFASLKSMERMDVGAGTSSVSTLQGEHDGAAVARLSDGTLFVGGGSAALGVPRYDLLELCDPATGSVLKTGKFVRFRSGAGAALLSGGGILVVGGWWTHNDAHTVPEWVDPATMTATATGPLGTPRAFPWVVPLAQGRALVLGGVGPQGQTIPPRPEIYDPTTKTFRAASSAYLEQHPGLLVERSQHNQDVADCRLADGRYVLMGLEGGKPSLITINEAGEVGLLTGAEALPAPPAATVTVSWQWVVDRIRGRVHVVQAVGNGTLEFTVTTVGVDGKVLATGKSAPVATGYYLHYSGFVVLGDGSIFIGGGHERDNFTPTAKTLIVEPPVLEATLGISLVPALWITAPKGTTCVVQYSTELEADWRDLAEVAVTNSPQAWVDLAPDAAKRFYQVRLKP